MKKQKAESFVRGTGSGPGVVNRSTPKYEHRTTKRRRSRSARRSWAIADQEAR